MRQAMIFAAGLGTRLRPLTDTMPKALVPVSGKPLLWHVVNRLREAGFSRIVVNVHHFASQIIDYLQAQNNFGLDIRISDESGCLLETGGGIKHARSLFEATSPVLIHNVDILSNADLPRFYAAAEEARADAMLLVSRRQTSRYLLFDHDRQLCGWTNTQTGEVKSPYPTLDMERLDRLAFSGIHILSPTAWPLMEGHPNRFPIMDFYLQHCHEANFQCYPCPTLQLIDVGKVGSIEQAEQFLIHHFRGTRIEERGARIPNKPGR